MAASVMIWKTCRVLANESRLRILRRLMRGAELCVTDLAEIEDLSLVVASEHLRRLHEVGFLKQKRKSKWIFYSAVESSASLVAQTIYKPLKKQLVMMDNQIPHLMKLMTAFTHPRRVEIIKTLQGRPQMFHELIVGCAISPAAMFRHLQKLISRGFVEQSEGLFRLVSDGTELKKVLIDECLTVD
jgi:DNA-binding transcriptional ArsR family regulator